MRIRLPLLLVFLGACGGGGGDDGVGGDGPPNADAPIVPQMITVSGTATQRTLGGSEPVADAMIGAYTNGNDSTPVATTTSDASGNYTLTITTNGDPLDGYVKATKSGLLDTYLYPPYALVADFSGASINMLTSGNLDLLSNLLCGNAQEASNGVIAVLVTDAAMNPVAGATVSSTPPAVKYCYSQDGTPNQGATMTDVDGVAIMLNVPAGQVTVSAMMGGTNFASHAVNARAGAFTTTPIVP